MKMKATAALRGFMFIQSDHSLKTWTLPIHGIKRKRLIAGVPAILSVIADTQTRKELPRPERSERRRPQPSLIDMRSLIPVGAFFGIREACL
jgi:hypothetical protein